jgi:anti-sigma B factor antagonist
MEISVANENGICHIGIAGEMNIYSALQARQSLLSAMQQCNEIEINLSHVSEIDAAGLQLLALVKREAAEKNKPLHFVAHSQAVMEVLDLCNLAGVFDDPVLLCAA